MSDTLPPDALAVVPDLPRATPVAGEPAPPDPQRPADLIRHGEAWDARVHVDPPTLNSKGRWKRRLRGNAARLALGLPMVGVAAGATPRPAQPPAPDPAEPTPGAAGATLDAEPAPSVSRLAWDDPAPGAAPGLAPGAEPAPLRPREAYATTAKGLVRAQFAVATIGIGPAWEPDQRERSEWIEAWQDFLHEYQLPVLGSAIALIVLACDSIARRRTDPDTVRVGRRLLDLVLRRKPALPPTGSDDGQVPAAPQPQPQPQPSPLAHGLIPSRLPRCDNPYGPLGR